MTEEKWKVIQTERRQGLEYHIIPLENGEIQKGHQQSWYCKCRPHAEVYNNEAFLLHRRLE